MASNDLRKAAQAVVEHWDDLRSVTNLRLVSAIEDLRAALAAEPEPSDGGNGKLARLREWIRKDANDQDWPHDGRTVDILHEIDRLMAEPKPSAETIREWPRAMDDAELRALTAEPAKPEPAADEIEAWAQRVEQNLDSDTGLYPLVKGEIDQIVAIARRLQEERDEIDEKVRRYRNDVGRLRAIMQEDDHRAWVAMGRPENTRTTNAVLICERLTAAKRDRDFAIASQKVEQGLAKSAEAREAAAIARVKELESEKATFWMDYRQKCDVKSKAAIVRAEKAEARTAELERAVRSLLRARGTSPEGYSTTAFKDDAGYFAVDCDRGVILVHLLDKGGDCE